MAIMTFTAMFTVKTQQKDKHCWPMLHVTPREGDSAYERGGDAHRKFGIKPGLKETDLGVARAFFYP